MAKETLSYNHPSLSFPSSISRDDGAVGVGGGERRLSEWIDQSDFIHSGMTGTLQQDITVIQQCSNTDVRPVDLSNHFPPVRMDSSADQ